MFAVTNKWAPLAGLLLIFLGTHSLLAEERQFVDHNCAITPPEGYQQLTNLPPAGGGVMVASFGNSDKSRLLVILTGEISGIVDDRFVYDFERNVQANSTWGERVSWKFIEIGGVKGYERVGIRQTQGKPVFIILHAVLANGKSYAVQAICFDGNISDAPELRKALNSFRFLSSPPALTPVSSAVLVVVIVVSAILMTAFLNKLWKQRSHPH